MHWREKKTKAINLLKNTANISGNILEWMPIIGYYKQ